MEKKNSSSVSRRSVLAAAGGAAVAAGLIASNPLQATNSKEELANWTELIGKSFRCTRKSSREKKATLRMTLANVHTGEMKDPNRPTSMRQPFSLVFLPDNSQTAFEPDIYHIALSKSRGHEMLLNEVMDMDTGVKVIEAVFG